MTTLTPYARRFLALILTIFATAFIADRPAYAAIQITSPVGYAPLPASDYYGINFIQPSEPWMTLAKESGAGVVRWQFNWRDAETSPGVYQWTGTDKYINTWNAAGIKIHAIMHFPPDWAMRSSPGLVPLNFDLAWNDPNNGWGQYCYKFAERYKGRIASYEIWNEPDLDIFWEGTAEEYFELMKTCYLAIKTADPTPPIAMAGLVILADRGFLPTVLRLASQDPQGAANNYYFDVANIHMYADSSLVYSLAQQVRNTLNTYSMGDKEIWITETNIALAGYGRFPNPDWGHVSEEEQAWYILQAAVNAHVGGVDRLMFFRLADDGMDESFGLVHQTGKPRASYDALKLATSILHNITEARREVRSGVNIAYFRRTDEARIVALYSEAGTSLHVQIEATHQNALLISADGDSSVISAEDGFYTVPVPPAPNRNFYQGHAVGGPVVFVVEQDTDVPIVTANVSEIPDDPTKIVLNWSGFDAGTGIESYEVMVSINDGPWESWQAGITDTQITFDVSAGGKYAFQVRAIDKAGNIGPLSEIVTTTHIPDGMVQLLITDLRGQPVPHARVTLADGTMHDADAQGLITIITDPGLIHISSIDGSAQGRLELDHPLEITMSETAAASWMLMPLDNLLTNGHFTLGLQGWIASAAMDATIVQAADELGSALRLHGNQRPWGAPAAAVEIDVPEQWSGALMSFMVRTPDAGTTARLRVIVGDEQIVLWQTDQQIDEFERIWVDLREYAGQQIMLRFEIVAPKQGTAGIVEIDDVLVGNVPILNQP